MQETALYLVSVNLAEKFTQDRHALSSFLLIFSHKVRPLPQFRKEMFVFLKSHDLAMLCSVNGNFSQFRQLIAFLIILNCLWSLLFLHIITPC